MDRQRARALIVLAFDTTLDACSAAVLDGERVLACRSEPMARGHQERLAPLVREVMAEAGVGFATLQRIGVTVGPGSFTGLRVGLAFAKGLGLALQRPVIGVGTLEALAATAGIGRVAAVVDAKRGQFWVQTFYAGQALTAPAAHEPEAVSLALTDDRPEVLVGSGAGRFACSLPGVRTDPRTVADPAAIARLATVAPEPTAPPRPLYLRAPDARLPGGVTPGA